MPKNLKKCQLKMICIKVDGDYFKLFFHKRLTRRLRDEYKVFLVAPLGLSSVCLFSLFLGHVEDSLVLSLLG